MVHGLDMDQLGKGNGEVMEMRAGEKVEGVVASRSLRAAAAPISISCPLESHQAVTIYLAPRRIGRMMDCWQCIPIEFYLRPSRPADRR